MQMLQLENGAQETPSPTSPGSFSHFLGFSTARLALPGGTAATQSPGNENSHGKGKKAKPHLEDRQLTPYKDKKKAAFCPAFGCFSYSSL